ncbi:MAG: hypothetical protein IKV91_00515 [Bacteroidales bacterium]|nr:hypothetical protein [Bacteroidales bacterium]
MENKELQILSEIKDLMTSLRSQMELLEIKFAQLQHVAGQEDEDMTPIDLDLDDMMVEPVDEIPETEDVVEPEAEVPETEISVTDVQEVEDVVEPEIEVPVVEDTVDDDLPFDDVPAEPAEEQFEEPVEETFQENVEEQVEEPVEVLMEESAEEPVMFIEEPVEPVADEDDDLPIFAEPEPEPVPQAAPIDSKPRQAVIDSMTDRQAWRTDMPGTPVKDIRSAISLNDRILFINMLFGQDPMAFQDALTKINQMASLDEVVDFVVTGRPEWDLESETVYRFMMAVRRKIR